MREMKDSGIKWIGEIPQNWGLSKVKYVASIASGIAISKECYEDDGRYEIVGANGIVGYYSKWNNNRGCLTTGRVGTIGTVHKIEKAWVTDNALIVYENENIVQDYLKYVIPNFDFKEMTAGTAMPLITATKLYEQFVPMPRFYEQVQIAAYLDSKCFEIDAIAADVQKEIETLAQYKRSVITEAVTRGLNPAVEMKDSGVAWCPQIPSHWQYTNPKGLFGLRTDRAFRNDRQLTASQEYGIVYQDEYMEKTGNKVVMVTKDFSILKHVEPDDFVISMRSFQGGLEYSDKRGCISSAYVMLIPNKELVYAPFYRWFFKSSKYINALQSTSNLVRDGQAMRYANFVKVPLFIIPIEEQKAIAFYLDEEIEKVNSILAAKKKQLEILTNYKKSLIYEYVTGKKEVLT